MTLTDDQYVAVLKQIGPGRCKQLREVAAKRGTTILYLVEMICEKSATRDDLAKTQGQVDRANWIDLREEGNA